jgi:hypothetical protein
MTRKRRKAKPKGRIRRGHILAFLLGAWLL